MDGFFERYGGEAPPGLEDASRKALEIRKVIDAFRSECLKATEDGLLQQIVSDWFRSRYQVEGEGAERNPYAAFKLQNPDYSWWYEKLDFLLEEVPPEPSRRFQLPIGSSEIPALRDALYDGELGRLIKNSKYLTPEENIAVAVMDARLWLCRSPLPVRIGDSTSYADIRDKDEKVPPFPDASSAEDVDIRNRDVEQDHLPSMFHVMLRERTVVEHWKMSQQPDLQLYHFTPSDFGPDQDTYWGHHAQVRFPHTTEKWKQLSVDDLIASLARLENIEEGVLSDLDDWQASETESMYVLLAEFIHGMTPSMHEELRDELQDEETDFYSCFSK